VGADGRVLATDLDPRFVDEIDAPNLEVRRHDITTDEVPERAFDLVHARAVLEHLRPPARAEALRRMVAALKPGGWLLAESGDYASWTPATALPEERAAFFRRASAAVFQALPVDFFYGRHLPEEMQAHGLVEVAAEGRVPVLRGASPASRTWRLTWAAAGERITASGVLTRKELEGFVALHDDPDFAWLGPVAVAAWGRRSTAPEPGTVQEERRPAAAGDGDRPRPDGARP
jgi:SAM-dependent methyltransferase